MKSPTNRAPAHLRPDTKTWWLHVHAGWRLEEHHSRLLTMACEAWDRAGQAREIMAKDGILLGGREGGARPTRVSPSRGMPELRLRAWWHSLIWTATPPRWQSTPT